MENNPEEADEPKKRKKMNKEGWKKIIEQKKRCSGREYFSMKTRKVVAARAVGEPYGCPKECFKEIGDEKVKEIFDEYWGMGDHNIQSAYLSKMVVSKEVKVLSVGKNSRSTATFE